MDTIKILNLNNEGYATIELTFDDMVYVQNICGVPITSNKAATDYIKAYALEYKTALETPVEVQEEEVLSIVGSEISM